MGQTLAAPVMNRPRLFIVLTVILWLIPQAQSHAQFGKGHARTFENRHADPVWVLSAVQGSNLDHCMFKSAAVKAEVSYMICWISNIPSCLAPHD